MQTLVSFLAWPAVQLMDDTCQCTFNAELNLLTNKHHMLFLNSDNIVYNA